MNIFLACLIVSLVDYLGFNYVYYTLKLPPWRWHIFQFPTLGAAGILSSVTGAWYDGALFTFLHFAFFNDALFYGYCFLFNIASWENRATTIQYWNSEVLPWAKFSFIGWFGVLNPKLIFLQAVLAGLIVAAIKILL